MRNSIVKFASNTLLGIAVAFSIIGTVPNVEIPGATLQGLGQPACATQSSDAVPVFVGGSCSGAAAAWVAASIAMAVANIGLAGTIFKWGKRISKLTPVGFALSAVGIFLGALGVGIGLISLLIAGECYRVYLSEVLL